MKNKILSYIICISVIFSCCTFMNIPTVSAASGNCGDNVYWSLDANGTLTISGTGDMYDYSSSETPWGIEKYDIKKCIIGDGITRIGNWSFSQFKSLSEVVIGNGVTSIGVGAFCQCDSLTTVNIPYGLKTIERYAFQQNDNLKTMFIPDSVTNVGEQLFYKCPALTDVVIGNGITTISSKMFQECSSLTNVTLPQTLTTIDNYAFLDCHNLSEINIPNNVSTIGGWSFGNCYNLKTIKLPENTKELSGQTFKNCTSLSKIYVPKTLKSIQFETFDNCTALTDIYYGGDKSMWKDVFIGSHNTAIKDATLHYNSTDIKNEITVVLNGEKIIFDQPPIMAEDRILVPIRKIAEAMGDTVMWNEEYQTAFIKHEDRGLIIKLLEDHIKIVRNEYWTQWEEKELDVVAFSLNGRTLVPVRAFCESLGADVKWDGESYTAYITYDFNKKNNEMTSNTFANINTVYYALNNDDVSFDAYSDDFNYFYNDRNHQKDAVKMGVSDIWAGINDLLSGLTNSENIMKNSFEQMLSVIPNNDVVSIDKELYDDIKDFVDSGKYIFDEVSGIDDDFLKLHPSLKILDTSIEAVGTTYDILSFSSEQLAVFLSNYEMNIAYIEGLRLILEENNLLDDELNTSLVVLQQEYSDKFFNVMLNTRDELEKFTIKESTNLATGGLFSVGLFTWEQLFKLSGITDDGQALKTFYGLYCINGILDSAYNQVNNKILSGNYTPSEVADLKLLDDLQRALKIKSYQCIKIISQDSETHIMCDEYVKQLSKSCILWKPE